MSQQRSGSPVPDGASRHEAAMLLIDVINPFEFPGAEELFPRVQPIAPAIAALKARVKAAGIPVIYVNDNFGQWHSNFEKLLKECLRPGVRGRPFVEQLIPQEDDYFVLKPKHSGFFQTPLDILLRHLGTKVLVLTGLTSNSCVLLTAQDAYMRDFELYVPPDCIAALSDYEQEYALRQMSTVLKAEIVSSEKIDPVALASGKEPMRGK